MKDFTGTISTGPDPLGLPFILPGDAGLSSSRSALSRIIRFGGWLHTGEANRSHAFAGVDHQQVIEALVRVRINDKTKYENEDIELWRAPLTDDDRMNFHKGMLRVAGDSYGWFKPMLAGVDSILTGGKKLITLGRSKGPVFLATRWKGLESFKDCSQLLVWGWHKFTTYRLLDQHHRIVPWQHVTPDYAQDLFHHPHNKMVMYYKQKSRDVVIYDARIKS